MITEAKVTYFDTAMALIEVGSVRVLTDPVLDPEGTLFDYGPVILEKTSRSAVSLAALGRIDAVLLSHDQHGDNLDRGGRELLATAKRVLTTPEAAARLTGIEAIGLKSWEKVTVKSPDGDALTITAVPAQHGPDGTQEVTGTVTGFLIEGSEDTFAPNYVPEILCALPAPRRLYSGVLPSVWRF